MLAFIVLKYLLLLQKNAVFLSAITQLRRAVLGELGISSE